MKRSLITLTASFALLLFSSCSTDPRTRNAQTTGAVVGGVAGGLISDDWGGAAVGAGLGALAGGALANQ